MGEFKEKILIIGGTRGIGAALHHMLDTTGDYDVHALGSDDLDLGAPEFWGTWARRNKKVYDVVVFTAGRLMPWPWDDKEWDDYIESYKINALGPVMFLAKYWRWLKSDATVVFCSSVGASNDGIVDLSYGMAKAALEKAARALRTYSEWDVCCLVYDLVDTDMMRLLPDYEEIKEKAISPETAAKLIFDIITER